ncbi:MAG: hypothetical protein H0U63_01195 [Burkholderiales bacterium]|nr:hypothetical protein [Burkholderiales bacterium]
MFGRVASGEMVDSNPYRDRMLSSTLDDVQDRIKASMGASGRYGSGAYGSAMSKGLGEVATNFRGQQYDADMARMMAGAQAASGAELQRLGLGNQAMAGKTGVEMQNNAQMMAAAQGRAAEEQARTNARLAAAQGQTGVQAQNMQNIMQAAGMQSSEDAQRMGARMAALQGRTGVQSQNIANLMAASQGRSAEEMQRIGAQIQAAQGEAGVQSGNISALMAAAQGQSAEQAQRMQAQLQAAQGSTDAQNSQIRNQLAAASMAPQLDAMRYADADRLMGVGAARDQMAQMQQQAPWGNLGNYMGVMGNGGGQTQIAPGMNPWASAAGAALTGGSIFGLPGAAIGGIGSLLSNLWN